MPVDIHHKLKPLYFFPNTSEVFSQKKLNENWHLQIVFLSEQVYINQPKICDANWLICKSISTPRFLSSNYFFHLFFCFIFDQNVDDEVLVSLEVVVYRMSLKSEILDLFLQRNIQRYNLKITFKGPRGNVKSGKGEGIVRKVFKRVFNVV